jgi:hypothetical protein
MFVALATAEGYRSVRLTPSRLFRPPYSAAALLD